MVTSILVETVASSTVIMAKDMPLVINGAENNFPGNPEWRLSWRAKGWRERPQRICDRLSQDAPGGRFFSAC
jgi:hypothetical protein